MSNIRNIVIRDVINNDMAVSTDDGNLVFEEIVKSLENNENVVLDFQGIDIMITAFLNVAIGKLYGVREYNSDFLNEHIQITNVKNEDINLFKKVVTRAKEYFKIKDKIDKSAKSTFDND